jgi:hypothetical protein
MSRPFPPRFVLIFALAPLAALALPGAASAQCEATPTGTQIIASPPHAGVMFGQSVGVSGDTVICGAQNGGPSNSQAFIFVFAGGFWTQQAALTGAAQFGTAVAVQGNTALIGDPDTHTLYVSTRSGTSWSSPQVVTPTTISSGDELGSAIAMGTIGLRNSAIVGAPGYAGQIFGGGAAFIFTFDTQTLNATWGQSGLLIPSDNADGDFFGDAVAISGQTAIGGCRLNNNTNGLRAGAAYIFVGNGFGGGWAQQAKITPSDGLAGDQFGTSVAISGDTVAIGSLRSSGAVGAVYIFTRSGTVWTQHQKLVPNGSTNSTYHFSTSIAMQGDRLVVGAPGAANPGGGGYIALYSRPAGSGIAGIWSLESTYFPPASVNGDNVGAAVALNGTRIVVGSPTDDHSSLTDDGSAYIVEITHPCPPDFDCSGTLAVADIFAFLNAWFAGDPRADFDGINGLQVADIFAFLNAWFAGC